MNHGISSADTIYLFHEALEFVEDLHLGVANIDIALKDDRGIGLIKRFKAKAPHLPKLAWSMYSDSP